MGKGKGFAKPKPVLGMPNPIEPLEQIATTAQRLERLLAEVLERRLSPRCYGLFKKLAYMPPVVRLVLNLKTVLGVMCSKDIENVLLDGLSKDERDVLSEADASGMSLESRRTAHSLLNIEARIKFINIFGCAVIAEPVTMQLFADSPA